MFWIAFSLDLSQCGARDRLFQRRRCHKPFEHDAGVLFSITTSWWIGLCWVVVVNQGGWFKNYRIWRVSRARTDFLILFLYEIEYQFWAVWFFD